ncbi:MAG: chemotaxis protein CheW [Bryobacterales bacterium]|jgi:purine-binding chemotaxis protein CheW|nr:chemotaxis protein CheW [Bryobacterales bacterium]
MKAESTSITEAQRQASSGTSGQATTRSAMAASNTDSLFVVVNVKPVQLAIPSKAVAELMQMPKVTRLPGGPPFVRGVCNLRGSVIPMVDLRLRLGLPAYGTEALEMTALLHQRATEHEHWVDELEACTREERPFTLATDPEKCAFGKWYRSFQTDNVILSSALKAFDVPHKAIHHLAIQVQELLAKGQKQDALQLIVAARTGTLARLLELFQRAEQTLRDTNREIAVFLDIPGQGRLAISVDEVLSVEQIQAQAETAGKPEELDQHDPLLGLTVQLPSSKRLVTMAHLEHLLVDSEGQADAAA